MCLALPTRLVERRDADMGVVDLGGVRKTISLALVPDAVPGDYVIVHVGYALGNNLWRRGKTMGCTPSFQRRCRARMAQQLRVQGFKQQRGLEARNKGAVGIMRSG